MSRSHIKDLTDIPNIGPASAKDLYQLGITQAANLIGQDPYKMYEELCKITNKKHDPCMIDIFISAVRYMEGGPARKWWDFTEERKTRLNNKSTGN